MKTLRPLALAALAVAGLAGTASAQYPYPQPPVQMFPGHHQPVVPQPVVSPPVVVHQSTALFPPPLVQPQLPVYCLDTFARDFHPCPGKHHILIIHPVTKCPVEVCFTLPDRKLKEIEVDRREIEFKYGLGFHKVEIDFRRNGTVRVDD